MKKIVWAWPPTVPLHHGAALSVVGSHVGAGTCYNEGEDFGMLLVRLSDEALINANEKDPNFRRCVSSFCIVRCGNQRLRDGWLLR